MRGDIAAFSSSRRAGDFSLVGGIIVAVGDDAKRAVRRAASPTWQHLSLWSAPRVAVAFCGERGGVAGAFGTVTAVDSEVLVDGHVAAVDAAPQHALRGYRKSSGEQRG